MNKNDIWWTTEAIANSNKSANTELKWFYLIFIKTYYLDQQKMKTLLHNNMNNIFRLRSHIKTQSCFKDCNKINARQ